jgi:hypothetical protein
VQGTRGCPRHEEFFSRRFPARSHVTHVRDTMILVAWFVAVLGAGSCDHQNSLVWWSRHNPSYFSHVTTHDTRECINEVSRLSGHLANIKSFTISKAEQTWGKKSTQVILHETASETSPCKTFASIKTPRDYPSSM